MQAKGRLQSGSLRLQVFFMAAVAAALPALGITWFLSILFAQEMRGGLEMKAGSLVKVIADSMSAPLNFGDSATAQEMASRAEGDEDFAYLLVFQPDGSVLTGAEEKRLSGLSDILSAQGELVFLRAGVIKIEGEKITKHLLPESKLIRYNRGRRPAKPRIPGLAVPHLFSSYGFLDDSWFHRS